MHLHVATHFVSNRSVTQFVRLQYPLCEAIWNGFGALIILRLGAGGRPGLQSGYVTLPFKHSAACRHRVDRMRLEMRLEVVNWPKQAAALPRPGGPALLFGPEAIAS